MNAPFASKIRTFVTNDDLLALQVACDVAGVRLEIGGDPTDWTLSMEGFERAREMDSAGLAATQWSVVYLHCEAHEAIRVRTQFRLSLGMSVVPRHHPREPIHLF